MDYPAYFNAVEMLTNSSVIPAAKFIAQRLDFDMIIMKLFLTILSFSTTNCTTYSNTPPVNLSNIKQILRIQDTYIELLWRYLFYKCDYKQAVKCFSDFIRCLFAIMETIVRTENVRLVTNTLDTIVELIELDLILDD
jgi:hypothetical protein